MVRRFSDAEATDIMSAYMSGETAMRIAHRYGTKPDKVHRLLTERGIAIRSTRKFSESQEREIAERYARGDSTEVMAVQYGTTIKTLLKIAVRHGVPKHRPGNRPVMYTAEQARRALAMYAAGSSLEAIRRETGLRHGLVRKIVVEDGTVEWRPPNPTGEMSPAWKTGWHIITGGYVMRRVSEDSPYACMAHSAGYAPEHRLVMAEHLGRPLDSSESVHHINGKRDDNRIENLQLRQGAHARGVAYRCLDCGSHNVAPTELKERQAAYA